MKKLLLVALALFLLAVSVTPVMAARGPRGPFALVGRITAIDPASGVVTVNVLRGSKLAQPYIGQTLALNTNARTRYLYKETQTSIPVVITFDDLEVGDPVSVNGTLVNSVWTANRITVGAKLSCLP